MVQKVAVIGGGLAGCAFVLAASQTKNHQLHLFEKNIPKELSIASCLQSRPLSLTYPTVRWLKKLGVWQDLEDHANPIKTLDISQAGYFGKCRIDATEFDLPAIAYVVPAALLQQVLWQHANKLAKVYINTELTAATSNCAITYFEDQQEKHAQFDLLIAADGTSSTVRNLLKIETTTYDFKELAFSAQIELAADTHLTTAYERFTKLGTIAVLPARSGSAGVVWTMPNAIAQDARQWDAQEWESQFTQQMPIEINSFKKMSEFALKAEVAAKMYQGGVVMLGNAAHTFYPIAAQGFNLALRDVMVLEELLADCSLPMRVLARKYSSMRQADCENVKRLTQWTANAFAIDLPLVPHFRGLALATLGSSKTLKSKLIERGFGQIGEMPAGLFNE